MLTANEDAWTVSPRALDEVIRAKAHKPRIQVSMDDQTDQAEVIGSHSARVKGPLRRREVAEQLAFKQVERDRCAVDGAKTFLGAIGEVVIARPDRGHAGRRAKRLADLLTRAWKLRENVTAYDAMYIALAEALDAPIVTCDTPLARAPSHRAHIEVIK